MVSKGGANARLGAGAVPIEGYAMNESQAHRPTPVAAAGDGWLVVDKPAGVSVHNDPGRDLCARVQALLAEDRHLAAQTGFAAGGDIHAPHRLDRDTSGLVLLCCRPASLAFYGAAFKARQIGKCYLAILHGRLAGGEGTAFWVFPLARSGAGRAHPGGKGPKVTCRTAFQVLGRSDHYTLAVCTPLTGRRHQIRRHAKLAGHPVVGDRRYGSARALRYLRDRVGFDRLALHACGLDLPTSGRPDRRVVLSPEIPREFCQLLAEDGGPSRDAWEQVGRQLANPELWPGDQAS